MLSLFFVKKLLYISRYYVIESNLDSIILIGKTLFIK